MTPPFTAQSSAFNLREAMLAAALRMPLFVTGFTIRRSRQLPIQKDQLPVLGVYFVDENHVPDGLGNSGELVFAHTARIGFSVVVVNNDPAEAEATLDRAYWALMNAVWRDPYLTNFLNTLEPGRGQSPDNVRFESVPRGIRVHKTGTAGPTNEIPVAELQYEVSLFYREEFAPWVEDDFEELVIETAFPIGGTAEERAKVQQVRQVLKFKLPTMAK